jgi:hypothetical protein
MFSAMNGRAGARAVAMQGARDQFLAGAGLAVDEHRDVGAREPTDGAEHLLHRRRLADDVRAVRQGAASVRLCCSWCAAGAA